MIIKNNKVEIPFWCRKCFNAGEYNKEKSKHYSVFVIKFTNKRYCKDCKKRKILDICRVVD